jgi:hypothetical protein
LHFTQTESTFSYFEATRAYLERYGKPLAFYSDRASVFRSVVANKTGCSVTHFISPQPPSSPRKITLQLGGDHIRDVAFFVQNAASAVWLQRLILNTAFKTGIALNSDISSPPTLSCR